MKGEMALKSEQKQRREWRRWAAAGLCAALAGAAVACKVSPDYRRPPVRVPATFKEASATESASRPSLAGNWWVLFGDVELTDLEARALYANQDVRAAMARVKEARGALQVTSSAFYPLVTLDPSVTRSRVPTGRAEGNGGGGTWTTNVRVPFDVSYEVDIWGRISRSVEAQRATVRQNEADFAVVLQTLEADLAQDYFSLRSLDTQSDILRREIAEYSQQAGLIQKKVDAAIANSKLDLVQVQALLQTTIAQEADLRRQRALFEHAIAQLVGVPPADFALAVRPLDIAAPVLPAGLPADLLGRRPDVAESEQALVAANASVGVAMANFYPVVTLTGAAGFESFDLQHTLDWQSRILSLGPNVTIPIFEGGKLTGNLRQAKARYDELLANYRQSLLTAFKDVEDNLSDLHLRAEALGAQEKAVAAARQYFDLSQVEYKQGIINSLQLIDADRTLLSAEVTRAQLLNERLASTVLLIKALGGGWDPRDPTAVPATAPMAEPVR